MKKGYKSNRQHSIDMRRARKNKRDVAQIRAMQLKAQIDKLELLEKIKKLRKEIEEAEADDDG